ncbi:MAG TPA: septum formation protein Maf [Candidatus Cottocaccamicrobium excrementipullorum]|nr:septum formation protein Maf [Candidatus Cottocaccamicrobium excrementipullorum]
MRTVPFILASASPRRKQLMEQIGLKPEIMPSFAEEKVESTDPRQVVLSLSAQKAEETASRTEGPAVVIGADTVVAAEGRILGKPGSFQEAEEMLTLLQDNVHEVYTGVTVIWKGEQEKRISFAEETRVKVYPMSKEEIRAYIATKDPMDKAGAYGIQGPFAAYIQGIKGDYNNVVGLPVGRLYQELKRLGCIEEEKND